MLTTLAILLVGGLAFTELCFLSYAYMTTGFIAIAVLVVMEQLRLGTAVAHLGSIAIYVPDVTFAALLVAALLRLVVRRSYSWFELVTLLLLALTSVALVRGVLLYGVNAAGNESREVFYLIAGTLYFSAPTTAKVTWRAIRVVWPLLAGVLVLVALVRLASLYAGIDVFGSWDRSRGILGVLNAQATLAITQALLVLLLTQTSSSRWLTKVRRASAAALLGVVLVMQQRTVWVATVGALVAAAWMEPRLLRGFVARAATSIAVVGLVVSLALGPRQVLAVPTAIAHSAQTTRTFRWRVAGWRALIAEGDAAPTTLLFGKPFGAGFNRTFRAEGRTWTTAVSPHSLYVRTFVRFGITGLSLFIVLMVGVVIAHVRFARAGASESQLLVPLGVTLVVFSVAYYLPMEQSLVLGLLIATAVRRTRLAPIRSPGGGQPYVRDRG